MSIRWTDRLAPRAAVHVGFGVALACGAAACAIGQDADPLEQSLERHALIAHDGDRSIFVIGVRPPGADLDRILRDEVTETWWMKVEVPRAALEGTERPLDSTTTFDLSSDAIEVVYADSFRTWCGDPDDLEDDGTIRCWLVLRHQAGDPGLTGHVTVHRDGEGLRVSYEVDWVGTFGDLGEDFAHIPPEAQFQRNTAGIEVIADEFVVETTR
jgi:hypothetical protein